MTEEEIYSLPFTIERFKQLPYNPQLEVMIAADGTIEYARPSHQEFLIKKAMELQGWSREELMSACPPEYYGDFMAWLHPVSGGYIPVWAEGVMNMPITGKQVAALKNLKLHGLFRGWIPKAKIE